MKLDVRDASGQGWRVTRRFVPWMRVIQPFNTIEFDYRRRAVTHRGTARDDNPRVKRKARREQRQQQAANKPSGCLSWLWRAPVLLLWLAVAYVVEAVVGFLQFIVWLILFPLWVVEQAIALLVGAGLWLARVTGIARSRVDVIGWWGHGAKMNSLTVILVRGRGAAHQLVRTIAAERETSHGPFDPARDPAAGRILAEAGAEVSQHDSIWLASVNPMAPRRG